MSTTTVETPAAAAIAAPEPREATPPNAAPAPTVSAPATPTSHTPGGIPAVPALIATGNGTVGLAAAAALAGGPFAVGVAAVGAVAVTTAVVTRAAKVRRERKATREENDRQRGTKPKGDARQHGKVGFLAPRGLGGTPGAGAARKSVGGKPGAGAGPKGLLGKGGQGTGGRTTGRGGSAGKGASKPAGGRSTETVSGGAAKRAAAATGRASGGAARAIKSGAGAAKSAVGAVKAARAAAKTGGAGGGASRAQQRKQASAARREAADRARTARAERRTRGRADKNGVAGKNRAPGPKARGKDVERIAKRRAARDARVQARVDRARTKVRSAHARRLLRVSRARHWGRCLVAAMLTAPIGVLGFLTTPLGRLMGWPWLMRPGRRMWARMIGAARTAREERDGRILAWDRDLAAWIDEYGTNDDTEIGDTVERSPRAEGAGPANTGTQTTTTKGTSIMSFDFAAICADVESAAAQYDPSMGEVINLMDTLPDALASFANVLRHLAEKADAELPLEPVVADALNNVFLLLHGAASGSSEIPNIFRVAHATEIRRLEDPRNGEDRWDTNQN